jgi:outer membrane protein assembly factor BamB
MRSCARMLFLAGIFFTAAIRSAETSVGVPLGSEKFQPTPERPFGWRGDGSGRFPGATPVTEWSATTNVRWSAVVGRSYSSPILTETFAVVTSEPNLLACVRRADGAIAWKLAVTPAVLTDPKGRKSAQNYQPPKDGSGLTAATPITNGQNIFAVFANGIVCAIDLDGKIKWSICIEAEPTTGYGRSASPIIVAGKLIVHMTHLFAFDPTTGKQLWVNTEAKSSYGTPTALNVGDADLIITSLGDVVRADDGKSVNSGIGRTAQSSPVRCGDGAVCFGDNSVSAIHLNAAFKEEEVWSGMIGGDVFGSPLWHNNTLFLVTGAGDLFAFDANAKGALEPLIDGRSLLEKGDAGGPAAYSSLTLAGNYLFLTSNRGETIVFEATRAAPLVRRNKLPGGTGSSPVFSGTKMFLRDGDKLFCIGK